MYPWSCMRRHNQHSGGKYAKLVKRHHDAAHLKSLEPLLVQSINYPYVVERLARREAHSTSAHRDKLFCALTCQLLTATAEAAATHMQGKKFAKHKGMMDVVLQSQ